MSIESFIKKTCVDDAVYWGDPRPNGQGGFTFADPIEVKCRWEEMSQLVSDNKGGTLTSRAVVYLLQDVVEEGMLLHGTLADTNSEQEGDPMSVPNAYLIKRFDKVPALGSTTVFLRKAYLTPSLSFGGF